MCVGRRDGWHKDHDRLTGGRTETVPPIALGRAVVCFCLSSGHHTLCPPKEDLPGEIVGRRFRIGGPQVALSATSRWRDQHDFRRTTFAGKKQTCANIPERSATTSRPDEKIYMTNNNKK